MRAASDNGQADDSRTDLLSWRRFSNTWSGTIQDIPTSPLSEDVSSHSSLYLDPHSDTCNNPQSGAGGASGSGGNGGGVTRNASSQVWSVGSSTAGVLQSGGGGGVVTGSGGVGFAGATTGIHTVQTVNLGGGNGRSDSGERVLCPPASGVAHAVMGRSWPASPQSQRGSQPRSSAVSSAHGDEDLEVLTLKVFHRKNYTGFEHSVDMRVRAEQCFLFSRSIG